jgi:hypothetical protein
MAVDFVAEFEREGVGVGTPGVVGVWIGFISHDYAGQQKRGRADQYQE